VAGSDEAIRAHERSAIVAISEVLMERYPDAGAPAVAALKADAWAIVRALNEAGYVIVKVKGPALFTEITDA
jgi:hypothetical protein